MSEPKIVDLDEAGFSQQSALESHLAYESFLALARCPQRELIVDRTLQRRTMKSGFLLAVAYGLSRRIAD